MNLRSLLSCFPALLCATSLFSQPTITSFAPASGPIGTMVTITGTNFSSVPEENIVYFGAVKASVHNASATTMEVQVPPGSTHQPITVTTNGLTASSTLAFHITFANGMFTRNLFSRQTFAQTGSNPYHVSVGDLDGDGMVDAVYVNMSSNTVSIFRNKSVQGTFSFDPAIDLSVGSSPLASTISDFDGDGKLDIAVVNAYPDNSMSIFRNVSTPGSLHFENIINLPSGYPPRSVVAGDLDGDGKPELVVSTAVTEYNLISVYRNTSSVGIVSFSAETRFGTGKGPYYVALGDLNGDGKVDMAVANAGSNTVSILKNTSSQANLAFAANEEYPTGAGMTGPRFVNIADLNGDQRPDLYVSNYYTNTIAILQNSSTNGVVSFLSPLEKSAVQSPWGMAIADFDGDGKPDLAVPNYDNVAASFSYYKNVSTAAAVNFTDKTNAPPPFVPTFSAICLAAADFDGDGRPDFAISPQSSKEMTVAINNGVVPDIHPSGASPVQAPITTKVMVDSSVREYNGVPYVQRHYDIEPASNASTATATVTLFFTQQEFDNYNAYPNHGPDLPKNPNDLIGIANLRVQQEHGFSTTSALGTYSGNTVVIDPNDTNIVWNANCQCWEITFEVNGFSGFFINTSTGASLPLTLVDFSASVKAGDGLLNWRTTNEQGLSAFDVERSVDARRFVSVGSIAATNTNTGNAYTFTDKNIAAQGSPVLYYRLKVVENDGAIRYSRVVPVNIVQKEAVVMLYPNPLQDAASLQIVSARRETLRYTIMDAAGRTLLTRNVTVMEGSNVFTIETSRLAAGRYTLQVKGTVTTKQLPFAKQ